ncbi:MAG: metallophosphoesterase, partial [Candidatus Diapherotrites archaeon]
MKLAIFSDSHLGDNFGTEREKDAFSQASQAIQIALKEGVDAILIPGDLFDSSLPRQEVFHEAFELLTPCLKAQQSELKVQFEKEREGISRPFNFLGIPVIALHGNHEYRSKGYKNPIEVLQSAGFLLHVHAARAVLKKGNEILNVYGLSSVPEKYALEALKAWNPKPESGEKNLLLMHQGIKEFLPGGDEMIAT